MAGSGDRRVNGAGAGRGCCRIVRRCLIWRQSCQDQPVVRISALLRDAGWWVGRGQDQPVVRMAASPLVDPGSGLSRSGPAGGTHAVLLSLKGTQVVALTGSYECPGVRPGQ